MGSKPRLTSKPLARQITTLCPFLFESTATQRETKSVVHETNTSGDNILIIWDPSDEDKFVTKTRDQPGPGWGDERPWERDS